MPKVAMIFTGGTISMQVDEEIGAAVPALAGQDIVDYVKGIDQIADLELYNFGMYPGSQMTPQLMMKLSERVNEFLKQEEVSGVVITHGTDTIEETAYFCDCIHTSDKPVIVVGAMRTSSDMGWDGPSNVYDAVSVAANPNARGKGVMLVMNGEIHAARDVTKMHTSRLDTFDSPGVGPLGVVDEGRVIFYRELTKAKSILPQGLSANVALIKTAAGIDGSYVRYCLQEGYKGLVIEGLGRGNVPADVAQAVTEAIKQDMVVVLCSRCPEGRVSDTYGFLGSGLSLRHAGVIFAGKLSGPKARILLLLALSSDMTRDEICTLFIMNEYGV